MKRIQLVTTGMMLLTMAFTSCKKTSYDDVAPGTATTNTPGARVIETNSKVTFTTGYLNSNLITVRDNQQSYFEAREPRNWDMFNPMQKMGMPMAANTYKGLTTFVQAAPTAQMSSVLLLGVLTSSDAQGNEHPSIPVTFMMNNPVAFMANSELTTLTDESTLINLLNVTLDKLTGNITADMWKNAMDYQKGTITISETQNPEIYKMILANMNTMLKVMPGAPTTQPSPVNTAANHEPVPVIAAP